MDNIHCVMLGLGGPTFISDWAKTVATFARVTGLTLTTRLPVDSERIGRNLAVARVAGFETLYVRRFTLRPSRMFWRLNGRLDAYAMVAAIRKMDDWAPDLIHSHFFAGAAGIPRAAAALNIPFVHTEHTSHLASAEPGRHLSKQGIKIMKLVFAQAASVMLVGPEQLEAARSLGAVGNLTVIPNPVDASVFSARPDDEGGSRLVTIGHLIPRKRHEMLLRAMALTQRQIPDVSLLIIGDGSERQRLGELVVELGLDDSVTFYGSTDRSTIATILARSDLYVHASERESFGVAIVEALLVGVPVVAARCGGVSGELEADVGMVVDGSGPAPLADAIVEALTRPRFATSSAISSWARRHFSFETVARLVREQYRLALSRS